ncbi:MAG TPA: glycoside hydrolase family 99-like domain-containing protein [bacterium]|nr:glycoside hydrolase family 99-like domain-containing protein [bacterium]
MDSQIRVIAFYLPQFHPIPENDEWWGKGFTDWTNVVKARPLFPGHYQPHLPADLGFYDLRLSESRQAQADLAKEYGIYGFCYYHYWFHGRRILNRPFDEVLASGKPDFPFCLCWANENWTRVWDGGNNQVIMPQLHSLEDDVTHIRALLPAFRDRRYVRIGGKPLLLTYRTELLPNPKRTAQVWRDEVGRAGIGDLYLARVESFQADINPSDIGFDAAVEFAPDWRCLGIPKFHRKRYVLLAKMGLTPRVYTEHHVFDYQTHIQRMLEKVQVRYKRFHGAAASWDNTSRRKRKAYIFHGSTPESFGNWLRIIVDRTVKRFKGDEQLIFVNAWNEWAEGAHLEPDQRWGRAYLEATRRVLHHQIPGSISSSQR